MSKGGSIQMGVEAEARKLVEYGRDRVERAHGPMSKQKNRRYRNCQERGGGMAEIQNKQKCEG